MSARRRLDFQSMSRAAGTIGFAALAGYLVFWGAAGRVWVGLIGMALGAAVGAFIASRAGGGT